ncbi:MAG: bifunctional riboflavin kinase/FAD synthetase, partial [Dehalococcoidia bacterium]|nr:bifunctional riboflavin kinase/FAD synthetase [Dehalococcoidia bacterium]
MLLVRDELRRAATPGDHALSIGVFDGVHGGHRLLVTRMLAEANARGLTGGVV